MAARDAHVCDVGAVEVGTMTGMDRDQVVARIKYLRSFGVGWGAITRMLNAEHPELGGLTYDQVRRLGQEDDER